MRVVQTEKVGNLMNYRAANLVPELGRGSKAAQQRVGEDRDAVRQAAREVVRSGGEWDALGAVR